MMYLLDTDTCIELLRGNPKTIEHIQAVSPDDVAISAITRYELTHGLLRCQPKRQASQRAKLDQLLDHLHEIPFARATAECAARLRTELESEGTPIGPMDTLIAATALESTLTLVTGNEREFSRINQLKTENWIR
jgi:tRNA(fMet)-specific endonuclease VapC